MLELLLVVSALVMVGLVGLMTTLLTPQVMIETGLWTLLLGLITGLPAGFWYHVLLYRTLADRVPLPRNWWTAPVRYHPHLLQAEAARIKPWFALGGIGFLLSLAGGLAAMAGLLLAR
jgi:hypothetical protein